MLLKVIQIVLDKLLGIFTLILFFSHIRKLNNFVWNLIFLSYPVCNRKNWLCIKSLVDTNLARCLLVFTVVKQDSNVVSQKLLIVAERRSIDKKPIFNLNLLWQKWFKRYSVVLAITFPDVKLSVVFVHFPLIFK